MSILNRVTFVLVLLLCTSALNAQQVNLEQLPAARRDSMLIEIAKAAVLKYGPGYWREYKGTEIQEPEIKSFLPPDDDFIPTMYPELKGKKIYNVKFFYDMTKERLSENFAAGITIVAESGVACETWFGNMRGLGIYAYEKAGSTTRNSSDLPIIPYEQAPKYPKIRPKTEGE